MGEVGRLLFSKWLALRNGVYDKNFVVRLKSG